MATTYKWANRLADWALRGRMWRRVAALAVIGAFVFAVLAPGFASFYLLIEVQENNGDLSAFFGDWRLWGASALALVAHLVMRRL